MAVPSPRAWKNPPETKDTARLLLALALILAALSYVNTLTFNFAYDDFPQLVNNARVHGWEHAPRLFVEQVWSQSMQAGTGNYYRPVFELWLLLQYSLFGLHPWAYHAASVFIHMGVVGLAYLLFCRLTDRLTAAMGAVLFAVHPTHIETVAWISGSTDLLCALFLLASFLAYLRAHEAPRTAKHTAAWQIAAIGLYALALMSKEIAIVFPALLVIFEWGIAARKDFATLVRRISPFIVTAVVYLLVRHWVLLGLLHPEGYSLRSVALTMPRVLWFYAYHLVWPFGLSVFYDSWFVSHLGMWDFYLPLAGVLAFSIALVWVAKKSRAAAFSAMWMLALLSPALVAIYVFIPDELVHDRYLYLPSVGFSLIAAIVIRKLKGEGEIFGGPRYQLLAVLALAGILAAGTAAQTVYWTNDLVLFAHGMGVAPRNVLAINHLANEMFKRNRPREALALYDRALQINPGLWQTHFAKGVTLFELADYRQANQQMEEAAKIAPENAEQFYFMGLSQLQMGDFRVAEEDLRRARALNPRRPGTHLALAIALEKQGRVAEAKEALRDEMRIYPSQEAAAELKKLGAE